MIIFFLLFFDEYFLLHGKAIFRFWDIQHFYILNDPVNFENCDVMMSFNNRGRMNF